MRNRQIPRMCQREQGRTTADLTEAPRGAAVQHQLRGASSSEHLDVAPQHPVRPPGSERLHACLLGGEPGGERRGWIAATQAVRLFALGEDPLQEPFAVSLQEVSHAIDLRRVEANTDDGEGRRGGHGSG